MSGIIGDNCTYHDDCRLAVDNSTCDDVTKTCVCEEAYLSNENGTFCLVREYRLFFFFLASFYLTVINGGTISFIFKQFLGKNCQNNLLAPLP